LKQATNLFDNLKQQSLVNLGQSAYETTITFST
jgi:hypothetical protein